MALKMLSQSSALLAKGAALPIAPVARLQPSRRSALRSVLVRAEEKKAEAPASEQKKPAPAPPSAPSSPSVPEKSNDELTKKFEELLAQAQQKWDSTSDSEKPAAIAIIIAAVVAQVAIGASVDAVERIPLLSPFLEFVGLAVTAVYAYRYATDPAEREGVQASIDSFTKAVTGKK